MNKRGESLIEVVISLFILVMAGAAITTLIVSSMLASRVGRDRFTAINLAREGIEAVTNMVATNWLRFPTEKNTCWNVIDYEIDDVDECSSKIIQPGSFYVLKWVPVSNEFNNQNTYFKWILLNVTAGELNLTNSNALEMAAYCLYKISLPPSRTGLLTQESGLPECSGFYRQITVEYPNSDTTKSMIIKSKVQWIYKSKTKTVSVNTKLYNTVY